MTYKLINCDSVIKIITKPDSLFHGSYCVDPYQNCEFGCQYCDSSFEKIVYVKKNINDVLEKELQTLQKGRVIIGSVNDPYQTLENKFQLTHTILETLRQYDFPCHILTKSPLILKDLPLISQLDSLITISLCSLDALVVKIFEPDVPSPTVRLETLKTIRHQGFKAGLALIPILPYIIEPEIESIVQAAAKADAQYLLHKHLELKGDQEIHVRNLIKLHYPHLLPKYDELYEDDYRPQETYLDEIHALLKENCIKYHISETIQL
ncbi:MAG: radical SAM protein [Candidatus Thermoplasmatota archaeon]|jgi:DNA repair photolyase|nr:radical SAM protein [Candidatus Thermoplasmatota archaeon]